VETKNPTFVGFSGIKAAKSGGEDGIRNNADTGVGPTDSTPKGRLGQHAVLTLPYAFIDPAL
jgi:hypothetical protein